MKLAGLAVFLVVACDRKLDTPVVNTSATTRPASIPASSVTLLDQYTADAHALAVLAGKGDCAAALRTVRSLTPVAGKILVEADALDTLSTTDAAALAWLNSSYKDKLMAATTDILTAVKSGTCIEDDAFKAGVLELSLAMGAKSE